MARHQRTLGDQLSLDVGGGLTPLAASFKVSGKLAVNDELMRGDEVTVTIADADGVVIAAGAGYVRGVNFLTHKPKDAPDWVERAHTIKLD